MTDNPSKTLDGSGPSPLTIDHGDRDATNAAPAVPEVRLDGDAAALQSALDVKYFGMPKDTLGRINVPSVKSQNARQLEGDASDSLRGDSQHNSEISRLSARLEVLTAESAKLAASGTALTPAVSQEMSAIRSSIEYQMNRQRTTQTDPQADELEKDRQLLLESYKNDMGLAVNEMMKAEQVDKATAMNLVERKIAVFGSAEILPRFSRIEARMIRKWPQSD